MNYFSYSPDYGFNTHTTEEEAKAQAERYIEDYRDDAHDGWDEDVTQVCWGEIKQAAKIVKREKYNSNNHNCAECDEVIDYGLVPNTP